MGRNTFLVPGEEGVIRVGVLNARCRVVGKDILGFPDLRRLSNFASCAIGRVIVLSFNAMRGSGEDLGSFRFLRGGTLERRVVRTFLFRDKLGIGSGSISR